MGMGEKSRMVLGYSSGMDGSVRKLEWIWNETCRDLGWIANETDYDSAMRTNNFSSCDFLGSTHRVPFKFDTTFCPSFKHWNIVTVMENFRKNLSNHKYYWMNMVIFLKYFAFAQLYVCIYATPNKNNEKQLEMKFWDWSFQDICEEFHMLISIPQCLCAFW